MPELDGISALPQLLAKKRDLVIIMASTLTRRNAEISFKALSLGASDYIPKPESTREADRRRNLPPRPDPEDPSSRRQGSAAPRPRVTSPPLAPALDRAREAGPAAPLAPAAPSQLARRAVQHAWRRACS